MSDENPRYECHCVKCNKRFFAPSKRALICLSCAPPTYQPSNLEDLREKLREEIANTGDT